jgi:hypothetical protein
LLLIITGLGDGTSDALVGHLRGDFFRLNLDDFGSYDFELSTESWAIKNPAGLEITSKTATRCLWWKPFMYQLSHDKYVQQEIKVIAQNIYSWFLARKLVIGNPPFLEDQWGKLRQAEVASKYFEVPTQICGWGQSFLDSARKTFGQQPVVVKSMAAQLTDSGKAVFTTEVDLDSLALEVPWYVQAKVVSDFDVTILFAGKSFFAFSKSRKSLTSLDWRKDQFPDPEPWTPYELTKRDLDLLSSFAIDMSINWGRADFLLVEGKLVFLEINPNGQWVFLDPRNTTGLLTSVAEYIESGETQ